MIAAGLGPREIAPGVHWLGGCFEARSGEEAVHYHVSTYLVVGSERTLLVDTGDPAHWGAIERSLAHVLGARQLDVIFPTHPELPHAGNLAALARRYPGVEIHGDLRDFHLYFPTLQERFVQRAPGDRIDLGDRELVCLPALVGDLPNTLWALDTASATLFASDGFSYIHPLPGLAGEDEEPAHAPGECLLLSSELCGGPTVDQAAYGTGRALYWTRFVDIAPILRRVTELLEETRCALIAPAHGNVVDDVAALLPIVAAAHARIYDEERSATSTV